MRFQPVPQGKIGVNLVSVPPSVAVVAEHSGFLKVGHNHLNRPLGDPYAFSDVPQASTGIAGDAEQHV